jgi:PAS domain S-box-containing protein
VLQTDRPQSRRLRASRSLWLVGIGLLVVILLAAGAAVWERRIEGLTRSAEQITNLGVVLAEQTARSIQAVDLVLQEVQGMVAAAGVDSPAQFESSMGSEEVHRFLVDRLKLLPQADAIGLVGEKGRLINGSRVWPVPMVDLSDRDYFNHFHQYHDPVVFISNPVMSRITGGWSFFLARRIEGPQGEFFGLVLGMVDIRYFEGFYQAITLREGGSVGLFRRDGTMLARYPHAEGMMGQKLALQSSFYSRIEEGGGTYRSPGYIDGIARIVAVHPLRSVPLAVTVSVSEDAVLADWRRQTMFITLGTLCTVVGFALLFWALVAHSRSLERSEATLRESEARCRDFALTSSDWFWETDENHRFSYLSDHIRAFGQDPQTRIGRTRLDLAGDSASEQAKWQEHFARLEQHEPFRDFVYARKIGEDPERFVSVSGNPFFEQGGKFLGYRGTARDITDKVMAERALRDAKTAAEAANLAKSQFLANMSHELRTPLNAILGFSEVLQHGIAGPLQSRQMEYIGLIRQSGEHLLHVINEILDLARIDAGKLQLDEEVVDPRRLVDECLAIVQDRAAASIIQLSGEAEQGVPPLMADRARLTEILLKLLSNAIKFTELGGSVSLAARRAAAGGVDFVVRDTGTGMTAAEIEIAFELFGQVEGGLSRPHEGTGLGLPLARKLAELHGGSLVVESEKGRGTTVTVTFPPGRVVTGPPEADLTGEAAEAGHAATEIHPIPA